jgi:hypothetical protein
MATFSYDIALKASKIAFGALVTVGINSTEPGLYCGSECTAYIQASCFASFINSTHLFVDHLLLR